jgi:hypothetical protein
VAPLVLLASWLACSVFCGYVPRPRHNISRAPRCGILLFRGATPQHTGPIAPHVGVCRVTMGLDHGPLARERQGRGRSTASGESRERWAVSGWEKKGEGGKEVEVAF